jgi:poly-gamma-glutamate synthesis protein (capsule biosynthesis protein)
VTLPSRVDPEVARGVSGPAAQALRRLPLRPLLVLLAGVVSACEGDAPDTSGARAARTRAEPAGLPVRDLATSLPGAGALPGSAAGTAASKPAGPRETEPASQAAIDALGGPPVVAAGRRITVMAVGDVLFGRYADRETYLPVAVPGHDEPFEDVAPVLRRADIALANVESPVLDEPAKFWVHARMTFRAGPEALPVLDAAGFDVLSFANNHALNFGAHGLRETLAQVGRTRLRAVGIGLDQAQADGPVLIESGGVRVAVLGRTTWLNARRLPGKDAAISYVSDRDMEARVAADVRQVRASGVADVVIVYLHWGRERSPAPGNHQRWAARAMIDAGADLVIGHHPHVVQAVERHGKGLIAYSLGNFLFDNGYIEQRRSVILEVTLEVAEGQARVHEAVLHPVLMERVLRRGPGPAPERVSGQIAGRARGPVGKGVLADRMWMPRLARGRDYRIWARLLAALAPGVAIAPEPPARSPVMVGASERNGASEAAGVVAPARLTL